MHGLIRWLRETEIVQNLQRAVKGRAKLQVQGGFLSSWAAILAATLYDWQHPALILVPGSERLASFAADLETLLGQPNRIFPFPPHPTLLSGDTDITITRDRIAAIDALHRHRNPIIVTTPFAICQPTVPVGVYEQSALTVRTGETHERDELVEHLIAGGYERVTQVEAPGQFAVRGDIVDFFSPAHDQPIRIELFGDEVESIRPFDIETQRSTEKWNECVILPAREFIVGDTGQGARDMEAWDEGRGTRDEDWEERIREMLEREVERLQKIGKPEQARLLRQQVEHDLERLLDGRYFDGCDWYYPFIYDPLPTIVDHLPPDTLVVWLEPHDLDADAAALEERWQKILAELVETGDLLRPPKPPFVEWDEGRGTRDGNEVGQRAWDEGRGKDWDGEIPAKPKSIKTRLSSLPSLTFTTEVYDFTQSPVPSPQSLTLTCHRVEAFLSDVRKFLARVDEWHQRGYAIVIATRYPERVSDWLRDVPLTDMPPIVRLSADDLPIADRINIFPTPLSAGFVLPNERLVVVTDSELFNAPYKPRKKRWKGTAAVKSPSDLREGDYVVHIHHGIGIYRGVVRQEVLGKESDYLVIEYAEGERLYVPVHQIDRVRKYVAVDGGEPPLSSLSNNKRWLRLRQKAKENAEQVAKELLELYARRQVAEGFAFSPDTPWQREMEDAFPFVETEDQLRAIEEVKADMESPRPMNRLVCGDVGFGKTEIAIRAAFKAVMDGKQVAMLVPTTVLALQHYQTFTQRLAPYPVKIAMLSRLQSPKEQKEVVNGLRTGAIDIVIGTHRLLSDDVKFRDLGLLIIDEEQRFGVRQKERLKRLQVGVDVLILTATPIPRTLHMALGGLLDMSLVNTPPEGRRPVRTYLSVYDPELVRFAIRRELERGGQVFYVYNRVQGIEHVAERVKQLVPEAKIAIAHGQMPEDELERVMLEFAEGKWDVLVCTTIIENGLDVPNANTLIVEHCERFGLAQLYQLRGRVGRSDRQAYAYFFHDHPKRLSETARKRLEALREFTDLGSGFRLALRDLEIRGAGNLLGVEQHGFINEVGFDLYMDMLAEAVRRLQGEPLPQKVELPEADLPVKAFIPETYVEDLEQRLYLYRKMAGVQSEEDIAQIEAELRDRYGEPPQPVRNILSVLRIRVRAHKAKVIAITHDRRTVMVRCAMNLNLSNAALLRLYHRLRETQPTEVIHCVRYERDRFLIDWTELTPVQLLQLLEDLLAALPDFLPQELAVEVG
ncbi:transcription-repair coupling factor [Candidatus Fervidibacteria bacterium JGI MDM2 SSWTFF-3-K9]